MMLDLNPDHLIIIKNILSTHAKDQTVWAYGSRVKGTAHAGSDLDLVILDTQDSANAKPIAALKAAFSESNLPIIVDISNWSEIPESFKEEIAHKHIVLQECAS